MKNENQRDAGPKLAKDETNREDLAVGHLKQATGKSPEPAGRNACPTSDGEARRPYQRNELVTMLEYFGLGVAGFDGLRSDAYEKQLAAASLEGLERVYEALLDPVLGFKEVRERCPVWPEGSRLAGKLPSMMTLREIKERILLEWKVQDRMKHADFAKRLQEVGLDDEQFMHVASMILGSELLSAKLDGTPVMENLRVVDRILRIEGLRLRHRSQKWKADFEKRRDAINAERENLKSKVQNLKTQMDHRQKIPASEPIKTAREPMIGSNARPTMQGEHHKAYDYLGENREAKNKVVIKTGYEPLDWLPALQKKDSLVEMIMASGKAKVQGF